MYVLNPNNASGDDGISYKMIKGVSKSISKPLSILLNRLLNEGIFPDSWKIVDVIPIFKKGDRSSPSNYRPVALLSCLGKLQERIPFKNINNFLTDNNLLNKYQSGFLPHHSTVFQLIDIYQPAAQRSIVKILLSIYLSPMEVMYPKGLIAIRRTVSLNETFTLF